MTDHSTIAEFATHLETLGVTSEQLETHALPTQTLGVGVDDKIPHQRLHSLPELRIGPEADQAPDLIPLKTLGEGGMGLVRLATQVSLDREVAVKTIRSERHRSVADLLLKEAYVTGYLEHPNIIPIYTVGRTDSGEPLIVMKRVEGVSWREALEEELLDDNELDLDRHLEVLIQVCRAVEFAHSRGILHRDIKTDNIMIGHFGEVYLLDWGLAVSLRGDRPLLPTVDKEHTLRGTPGYMPPEMARQQFHEIDERSDIYLLGATLHHLLTGSPRHRGNRLLELLFSAALSRPFDYGEDVPDELAAIANKACHLEPDQRFESATDFRRAIQSFRQHRDSLAVSAGADEKLEELESRLQAPNPDPDTIHDVFGECRFGYRQAARLWPENPHAARGLQRCLKLMVHFYLGQQNAEAARSCLVDLEDPDDELRRQVDELTERLHHDRQDLARLKEMESDLDLRPFRAGRSLLTIVFGVIWTATTTWAVLRFAGGEIPVDEERRSFMIAGLRNLGIVLAGVFLLRKSVMANAANRQLALAIVAMVSISAILRWGSWQLETSLEMARLADSLLVVLTLCIVGVVADLRIALISVFYLALAILIVVAPGISLYFFPLAIIATMGSLAWIWSPSQNDNKLTW